MPYNPYYYPNAYQPVQQPAMPSNSVQNNGSNLTWVQGEASAKSFPVGNGQSVLLMDSEDSVFYIKSTDQSGMPMPLRIFDYTERKSEKHEGASVAKNDYVSREEFNAFKEDISKSISNIPKHIARPSEDVSK